jgi:hypothetical protein
MVHLKDQSRLRMNYQIITDEEKLIEFINWLPELKESEIYYCCLFARSKYTKDLEGKNGIPHIKSDKAQLKRFVSTKDRLLSKIRQLECPVGSYIQGVENPIIVPQEGLALYITVNPRNMWTATKNCLKHFAEVVITNGVTMNPQADAMSEIQRSKGTRYFSIADLDTKDPEKLREIDRILHSGGYRVLETRGGYHVIIHNNRTDTKWHATISAIPEIDQIGDIMIPVPGTYQGGFTPTFIK